MQTKPALLATALLLSLTAPLLGQPSLDYYLPADVTYEASVPTPSSLLGYEVGEWHVRHDQLVAYMRALAASSDRIRLETTGRTHEGRELLLLILSSPANLERLEEIREEHLKLSDPGAETPDTSAMPLIVYMGYSIHGNEPSGSNASLLVAYHLAAGRGEAIDELLANTVILLDPSLNPDGLGRYAEWANMHRGAIPVADPDHREHREGWPAGRSNHYWFDLNRDWLPLVHPESQARMKTFQRFRPNLLTDHHEMGSESTFFFQPGIPIRRNPLTPEKNYELTAKVARYHAAALDKIGSLYYTEETFDDFYYGKGSTYPDVNGAVGILFEQAGVDGHVKESPVGELSFPFAVRNQLTTSFSTLEAAVAMRRELLDYQAEFYRDSAKEAESFTLAAYVFGDGRDPYRTYLFVDLLRRHGIAVHELGREVKSGDERFLPGEAYVVPLRQPQFRLIRAIFERRVEFPATTFYDVSTWTVPLAYGLPFAELESRGFAADTVGEALGEVEPPHGRFADTEGAVAYAFEWDGYFAPRALYRLLAAKVRVRAAGNTFSAPTANGVRDFGFGTVVVPLGIQDEDRETVTTLLQAAAERDGVDVWGLETGLTPEGIDLGSPRLLPVEKPKPALVVGPGVSSSEVGEIWHLLDRRFEIPVPLVEKDVLARTDIHRFTHLVFVDGDYSDVSGGTVERLREWVREGGVVIATKRAAVWADSKLRKPPAPPGQQPAAADVAEKTEDEKNKEHKRLPYVDHRDNRAKEFISGAIFRVELDITHPIAFGYRRGVLPVFRNSRLVLPAEDDPYVTVAQYAQEPLLSGYVSAENLKKIAGSPAVIANRVGRGTIVRLVDDPSFRGFWHGTDKLFMNALFFGSLVENTTGSPFRR